MRLQMGVEETKRRRTQRFRRRPRTASPVWSYMSNHSPALRLQGLMMSIAPSTKRRAHPEGLKDDQRQTSVESTAALADTVPRNGASDDGYSWARCAAPSAVVACKRAAAECVLIASACNRSCEG